MHSETNSFDLLYWTISLLRWFRTKCTLSLRYACQENGQSGKNKTILQKSVKKWKRIIYERNYTLLHFQEDSFPRELKELSKFLILSCLLVTIFGHLVLAFNTGFKIPFPLSMKIHLLASGETRVAPFFLLCDPQGLSNLHFIHILYNS